ncbi:MAG: hypothetical protein HY056_12605 [Proteobacteria bacterium]|nr:hypothetical protein [Pseudomonadota bacterium]
MSTHHQHDHGKPRFVEFLQRGFDVMDRFAQRALKTGILAETELAPGRDDGSKVLQIFFVAGSDGGKVLTKFRPSGGVNELLQGAKIVNDCFCQLGMSLEIFLVAAKQKVLFGAAALEQMAVELRSQGGDGASVGGEETLLFLRGAANQINAPHDGESDDSDRADGGNFVGDPKMKNRKCHGQILQICGLHQEFVC